jgi:hypothetical protein
MANIFPPSWMQNEQDYMEAIMAKQMGSAILGSVPKTTISPAPYTSTDALKSAINARMRGTLSCDFWYPVFVEKRNMVVLFIIQNGDPVILEDEFSLFPSDALVTKLRLL